MRFPRRQSREAGSRSWPRRLLVLFNILLATVLVCGIAGLGYAKWRFGQISKIDIGDVLNPDQGSGEPLTVLMVGSDTRANLSKDDQKVYGTTSETPGLADTIMLLRVDPKVKRAAILSIPRDTWVTDGTSGSKEKINASFSGGGAQGTQNLIKTINKNFDITIDHYAQVDFDGFKGIVDAVDGVTVRFDAPARDTVTQFKVDKAGCISLNGDQALAYVRARHYQVYENGKWQSDPRSDLSRIDRQQDFIRRVIRKSVQKGTSNPLTLNSLVSAGVKNLTLDRGFGLGDVTGLAKRFQSLDPSTVEMMTLPTTGDTISGQSVLVPNKTEVTKVRSNFLNGSQQQQANEPLPSIAVGSISVRVLNGSGVPGQASDASGALRDAGFVVSGVGDGKPVSTTTIHYASGDKDKAETIAKYIGGGATLVADSTVKSVDAIIVTGSSFTGINGAAPPVTETTTTTAPSTQSTTTTSPFVPADTETC